MWEDSEQEVSYDDEEDIIPKRKASILRVSRQISAEALDVLYGRNLFIAHVHGGAQDELLKFGTPNLKRIRYLRLVAQPMGCFPKPITFDSQFWIPLLTDLSQFCLVAQQPLPSGRSYHGPIFQENMREWIAWLEPIVRYLAQNISGTTIVAVDDNNLEETRGVVQKYFHSGYRRLQTVSGDIIFERSAFSLEPGYWDNNDGSGTSFVDGGMDNNWSV